MSSVVPAKRGTSHRAQAIALLACPTCESAAGSRCINAGGDPTPSIHATRQRALVALRPGILASTRQPSPSECRDLAAAAALMGHQCVLNVTGLYDWRTFSCACGFSIEQHSHDAATRAGLWHLRSALDSGKGQGIEDTDRFPATKGESRG